MTELVPVIFVGLIVAFLVGLVGGVILGYDHAKQNITTSEAAKVLARVMHKRQREQRD